jgi:hypothetical protein
MTRRSQARRRIIREALGHQTDDEAHGDQQAHDAVDLAGERRRGSLDESESDRRRRRPDEDVGAAGNDGDERLDDEACAHHRAQRHRRRVETAGEARERGAEAEGDGIDAVDGNTERARHRGVLHRRPRVAAETGLHEEQIEADQDRDGDRDQHETVDGERRLADRDAAERRADARCAGPQQQERALGHDEADAPSRNERVDRPMVEAAHDRTLEEDAEEAGDRGAGQHGKRQRRPGVIGICGDIAAHGDELAMGHVDDPHHAEDDREPRGGEHQERKHVGDLVEVGEDLGRLHLASL